MTCDSCHNITTITIAASSLRSDLNLRSKYQP